MREAGMRTTWDAAAASEQVELYVGDRARGREELEGFLGRLGADPRGGVCVELGCGFGRMTEALAERFDRVLALDVSPAMLERARESVAAKNVEFRLVSGLRLEPLDDGSADAVVCYLVLQHMPRKRIVLGLLREIGRVLRPGGEAYLQLPVLDGRMPARTWRFLRGLAVPVAGRLSRRPTAKAAYRGFRLTDAELARGLADAGLRVLARDESSGSPYRFSREVFLRVGK
jgi:ubiquinone/menaquinone biosynthesis C-methylase UbiE